MAGANLTDDELRDAAAEAGISPQELRNALAERREVSGPPAKFTDALLPASRRGTTASHVEGRVSLRPKDALASLRGSIERQTGARGHAQGEGEADIVDERAGLTYRLRAEGDGAGGALVRVDIDPAQTKGNQALAITGVAGISATLVLLGLLLGAAPLWWGGLGIGIVGGLLVGRNMGHGARSTRDAHAIAARALLETEDKAPIGALPPAGR